MNETNFQLIKILNNIKQHDFDIGDYKLCPEEAKTVSAALRICLRLSGQEVSEEESKEVFDELYDFMTGLLDEAYNTGYKTGLEERGNLNETV